MESNYNFPKSGPFAPGRATEIAKELGEGLEKLALQQAYKRAIIGAGLFKVNPATGALTYWDPNENGALNKAMKNKYSLDCSSWRDLAQKYCAALVEASSVLAYVCSKRDELTDFNVIVHLHYYRNREKPDQGFHKDTRGQTLFFMLHYLSESPVYGAEWMRERGLRKAVINDDKSRIGYRVYNQQTANFDSWYGQDSPPKDWKYISRVSPAQVEGVWPLSIRQDVLNEKRKEPDDDKVHVFRVDPYGAVLVVDDIVHHRTPNPKSRSEWGLKNVGYPQVSHVQAYNAKQVRSYYEIERGRSREREVSGPRGRSRSRSMSNEREKKEKEVDQETTTRWAGTFNPDVRRFFRIWVTVSRNTEKVWY